MASVAESIGYLSTASIDDGSSHAYVQIFNNPSFQASQPKLGMIESKRLDIASRTIVRVPGVFTPGDVKMKVQLSNAGYTRIQVLMMAVTASHIKTTMVDDSTGTITIHPGYFTELNPSEVEVDKITELDVVFAVSGPTSEEGTMQTKEEFLAAFAGKPCEITVEGKSLHILPMSYGAVQQMNALEGSEKKAQFAFFQCVCSPDGKRLFEDTDLEQMKTLPLTFVKAVFDEIAARLKGKDDDSGKASSPTTTS